jgi:hypothetical protein
MLFYEHRPPEKYNPELDMPLTFETHETAKHRDNANVALMRPECSKKLSTVLDIVENCRSPNRRCGFAGCVRCTRLIRRYTAWQSRFLCDEVPLDNIWMLTVHGDNAEAGKLRKVSLRKFTSRLRKRIHRTSLHHTVIIGGIELAWQSRRAKWRLHAHLIVIRPPQGAIEELRAAYEKDSLPGEPALRCDPVRDVNGVSAYILKQLFYHHPGDREGHFRRRAQPLPKLRAQELALWLSKIDLQDRLFLNGCRRRGRTIVPASEEF